MDSTRPRTRATVPLRFCYRACDNRFPFLWFGTPQPPGRWHDTGEGPCHYLATTSKGAWAEVIRHEGIDRVDDLLDLERSLWEVAAPLPDTEPELDEDTLTGDESTYPACRAEARRLRSLGHVALRTKSAALISGMAELYGVDADGQMTTGVVKIETVVLFGSPVGLVGMPDAEGHPDPTILEDVRPL